MKTISDLQKELLEDYGDKIVKSIADEDYEFIYDICSEKAIEGLSLATKHSQDEYDEINNIREFIRISLIELITQ